MQTNLTIDRGNSAFKAVVWEGRQAIWRQTFPEFLRSNAEEILGKYNPAKVIFCSVGADDFETIALLREVFGNDRVEVLTRETAIPIEIDYRTPATLGFDRVAAAIGAAAICPGKDVLVVDIGTAVTYDVVSADGKFRGGNIAPGIGMRLKALNRFTARLPLIESRGETPDFGYSTETAMRTGAVRGVVAEILYYHSLLPQGTQIVITGGWGADIARLLPMKAIVKPCLVSIGLNSILSYNETK